MRRGLARRLADAGLTTALLTALLTGCEADDHQPQPIMRTPKELRRAFPDSVAPPKPIGAGLRPRLAPTGSDLRLDGSLASGSVSSRSRSFVLSTQAGPVRA